MSARVKRWQGGGQAGYNFRCPGCGGDIHSLRTEGGGASWTFNDDIERPVFGPSVLVTSQELVRDAAGKWTGDWVLDAAGNPVPSRCHSFVGCNGAQPGQIIFLGDCTHARKGQVVELPIWERPA